MSYKIIDNFLDKDLFLKISDDLTGENTPWFLRKQDVDSKQAKNKNGYFSFCYYNNHRPDHPLYYQHIEPILKKLNVLSLVQVRANLVLKSEDTIECGYHIDYNSNKTTTGILFLTECNAKTVLKVDKDEIFINNKENRMLLFNTNILHKVIYQTDVERRYIINFNFLEEDVKH